jgi:DNA-directed RNA polymerase specialized sigma54-like protein
MEGNVCRCGTYPRIVEAIRFAQKLQISMTPDLLQRIAMLDATGNELSETVMEQSLEQNAHHDEALKGGEQ